MKRIFYLFSLLALMIVFGGMDAQAGTGKAVVLNHDTLTLVPGQTEQLEMWVGNAVAAPVSWKSSKSSVATVTKKGIVKAKKAGKCTITCKTGFGYNLSCKVTVRRTIEISKYLNKSYTKLLKAESKYVKIEKAYSDPLGENNLYLFPDNSLFFRYNKKNNKISVLQNAYDPALTLYGSALGMKAKTSHKTLKANKCVYKKKMTNPSSGRTILYYEKSGHTIEITIREGKVEFFKWY